MRNRHTYVDKENILHTRTKEKYYGQTICNAIIIFIKANQKHAAVPAVAIVLVNKHFQQFGHTKSHISNLYTLCTQQCVTLLSWPQR